MPRIGGGAVVSGLGTRECGSCCWAPFGLWRLGRWAGAGWALGLAPVGKDMISFYFRNYFSLRKNSGKDWKLFKVTKNIPKITKIPEKFS
jgi:hypothetical protein